MRITPDKSICELLAESEHENVVLWSEPECGYRGIIAIHSTALGPAVGGTRFWNYECDKAASRDALRLSQAMSYKNALAGLPFGGGKAVIIGDSRNCDREQLFRAHGRFIESLGGRYITGEDIGTTPADMDVVRTQTTHVAGLPSGSGDPSPMTAFGVFKAMQACAKHRWGTPDLAKRSVAIQGCGATGYHLAKELHLAGAKLLVTDIDAARLKRAVEDFDATVVATDEIVGVEADVFAPCAFGGVINDKTIPKLKVEIVVGSANNQLQDASLGDALRELDVLYGPDCVANAGGMINGCRDLLGWETTRVRSQVEGIYDRMLRILQRADELHEPPSKTAETLARDLLATAKASSSH
jgi:leucine dehydrogenase